MARKPSQDLARALADPIRPVRLGALRAAPWLDPTGAAVVLTDQIKNATGSQPREDIAAAAIALAQAGGDPLPMVADLLQDSTANLEEALGSDYHHWQSYLLQKLETQPPAVFNSVMPFYATWRSRAYRPEPDTSESSDPDVRMAHGAMSDLRFWQHLTIDDRSNWMKAVAQDAFEPVYTLLEAGRAIEAATALTQLILTTPNDTIRFIGQMALPTLAPYASAPLLSALDGNAPVQPDVDAFNASARRPEERFPKDMTPKVLAAFLAGEALEQFSDSTTAFSVVNLALAGKPELRARAARVTARMSAEVALPPLTWCALNLPSAQARDDATNLLDRIVANDPALGLRLHHIRATELKPDQLGWLNEIVAEGLEMRGWLADASVGVPILREAVRVMPNLVGEAGYVYSEPPTSVMASNFMRSMSSLRNWFGGALPRVKQRRYPKVTLPSECSLNDKVTLSVQLMLATVQGDRSIDVEFPRDKAEVELEVLIHAPGFSAPDDHKTIRVPRDQPSEIAAFTLQPRVLGQQAIDIKFMLGTDIVGQCCAITEVRIHGVPLGLATTIVVDQIDDFTQLHTTAQAVLRVKTLRDGVLAWSLQKPDSGLVPLGRSAAGVTVEQAASFGERQKPHIREMLESELGAAEMTSVLSQLSTLGYELYAQIAPATLKAELDVLQENALVVIDSDADWIPWELLASDPTEPLWGERFVLIRAPVMTRPPIAKVAEPAELSPSLDRALLVVGDEISQPTRLSSLIFRGMAPRAEPILREKDFDELCRNVAGKDIVHFACHGRGQPNYHLSFKAGVSGHLLPGQAHALGLKWGAVVFANACGSATGDLLAAAFQSFGREFYYAGARPFIGTLGPVPEAEAAEFAALFYEQFALAGLPAGQAMRLARRESRSRFKRPVWLFYCLYGNPSLVRRWSAA